MRFNWGVEMRLAMLFAAMFHGLMLVACAGGAAAPPAVQRVEADATCPNSPPGTLPGMDVVIAIDTSRSTRAPSGFDVDRDGLIGELRHSEWTDRDDSILAAEIAAVRRLLSDTRGQNVRFALVAYSGRNGQLLENPTGQLVDRQDARIRADLTQNVDALDDELAQLGRQGSKGNSSFAPPMKLALRALKHPPDGAPAEVRRILFLSDSSAPIRDAPGGHYDWEDRRMRTEAIRAIKDGIAFDTFGIGQAATASTPHTLTHIAGATGGRFHAVADPARLHCALLGALSEPRLVGAAGR